MAGVSHKQLRQPVGRGRLAPHLESHSRTPCPRRSGGKERVGPCLPPLTEEPLGRQLDQGHERLRDQGKSHEAGAERQGQRNGGIEAGFGGGLLIQVDDQILDRHDQPPRTINLHLERRRHHPRTRAVRAHRRADCASDRAVRGQLVRHEELFEALHGLGLAKQPCIPEPAPAAFRLARHLFVRRGGPCLAASIALPKAVN